MSAASNLVDRRDGVAVSVAAALIDQLWPYAALCVWAFLAATLLPLGSEVALAGQIKAGLGLPVWLVIAATVGNVSGSLFNWWLGTHVRRFETRSWFPVAPTAIDKATAQFNRWGVWSLLLAWLPVIGDPLTLVAGILRVPLWLFLPLVTIGKAARYSIIAALI